MSDDRFSVQRIELPLEDGIVTLTSAVQSYRPKLAPQEP
jgi:hypothetical protein